MTNRSLPGVSPLAFIGEGVTLGTNVSVGPYAVILGPTTIGNDVWIGPGAQIGAPPEISSLPQNRAWQGDLDHFGVEIGEGAVIREGVVIHQGSYRATTVGAHSWILNRAYLAHDVLVGEHTTVSAGVSIGGHCVIGDRVNLGMNVSVHQRRIVAPGAMVGMGTPVTADVPPFAKVYGTPARVQGINSYIIAQMRRARHISEALFEYYREHGTAFTEPFSEHETLAEQIDWWLAEKPSAPMKLGTR